MDSPLSGCMLVCRSVPVKVLGGVSGHGSILESFSLSLSLSLFLVLRLSSETFTFLSMRWSPSVSGCVYRCLALDMLGDCITKH